MNHYISAIKEYKYLGVKLSIKDNKRNAMSRLRQFLRELSSKPKLRKGLFCNRPHKLFAQWWTVSRILYYASAEVPLGWLDPVQVEILYAEVYIRDKTRHTIISDT